MVCIGPGSRLWSVDDAVSIFRNLVLHRAWIPAVLILTVAALVPRAKDAANRMSRVSRAAGVLGGSAADPNEFGDKGFRWMKPHAALHEPVRGRVLSVPLFVDRPGIEAAPVTLRVTVAGVVTPAITLQEHGWRTATFNLYEILGESDWRSLRSVTLEFKFTGLTGDVSFPGVGLGDIHWIGSPPR